MRCGLTAAGATVIRRCVRAVWCGRATAGAASSAAAGTVVGRVLTGAGLTHTPAAQQGHLGEDLKQQNKMSRIVNPDMPFYIQQ